MRLRFLLFFAILTQTVPGQQPVPFPQLRQTWIAALESRDLKASLALYTPNAAFIDPDGTRAATPDALRQLYTSVLFNSFTSKIQLTSRSTDQSGDLAFDSGSYAKPSRNAQTKPFTIGRGTTLPSIDAPQTQDGGSSNRSGPRHHHFLPPKLR